ncbi:MAG TPA: hypothetical protein VN083_06180 [Vicinamibacteria bacterium]|jgi:hypothetical protein|nr:hypothetical protein [Vicinamibacteria bacterium]
MRNAPLLGRLLFVAVCWVGFMAVSYVILDGLGVWQALPQGLTHAADVLTGLVLVFALVGHLLLATGRIPPAPFEP